MAGHKNTVKPSKCAGVRKDGSPCNSFAAEDGLCSWHLRLRDEGATTSEADLRKPVELLPLDKEHGNSWTGSLGGIRGVLRAGADANSDKIVASLVEVLDAFTTRKVRCPKAGCGYEFAVTVPDGNARANAAKQLVELGYGAPPKDEPANTATVELGDDPYTLGADELRARRDALARAYPEAARELDRKARAGTVSASKGP
jgi:hypothetical protein